MHIAVSLKTGPENAFPIKKVNRNEIDKRKRESFVNVTISIVPESRSRVSSSKKRLNFGRPVRGLCVGSDVIEVIEEILKKCHDNANANVNFLLLI